MGPSVSSFTHVYTGDCLKSLGSVITDAGIHHAERQHFSESCVRQVLSAVKHDGIASYSEISATHMQMSAHDTDCAEWHGENSCIYIKSQRN